MSASPVLIAAKLARPPARPNLVARPRLFARLAAAPLTLVTAPAGFGKTTLVSAWLDSLPASETSLGFDLIHPPAPRSPAGSSFIPHPCTWLSLDHSDNDLTRFLTYLLAALGQLQPDFGAATLALLQSPQPAPEHALLATLVNELQGLAAALPAPAVLVLDDLHALEAAPVLSALAFILEHLPPQLRVILTSRAEPTALPLARWRARGRLAEVALDDLRFTASEAQTFFHDAMGLALPAETIQALTERTEGWVAGLQLAALAQQGSPAAGAEFSGTHRYVADYLLAEVLSRQPPEIQSFLRAVAFLDRLCGPLCDAVLKDGPSEKRGAGGGLLRKDESDFFILPPSSFILDRLARANLFLTRLDDQGHWYRLHQLFREFLQQPPDPDLPARQRRASSWFAQQPDGLGEAVALALAAGDTDAAAALMAANAPQLMQRGEFTTLRQWLDRLPEPAVWANPRLGLARVWMLLDVDQPQQALAYLERYNAYLDREATSPLRAEVLALSAISLAMQRQPEQALAAAQQAEQAGLESDPFVQTHVLFSLAAAHKMGHQNVPAEQVFRQAAAVAAANANPYLAFSCFGNLGDLQFNSARLREAEQSNRRALEYAAQAPGGEQPYAGWLHWSQARIYYEWNDLDAAQREAEQCWAQCELWGSQAMALRARLVLAQVQQARHAHAAARASLEAADHLSRQVADERLVALVTRQRVGLAVAERDLDLAQRWAALLPTPGAGEHPFNHCLTLARLRLAEGQPRHALEFLAQAHQALAGTDLVTFRLQVLVLEVVARRALGQPEAALEVLERALVLAGPGGFVRTFLDEGAPMRELLRRVVGRSPGQAEAQRLLAAFAQAAAPAAEAFALTGRERQILRLMAAGLSNRAMAAELVIAEATLKRHVSNLYGKLEAHSRTQALARAASLKLL